MAGSVELVIFDCDGVLVDSERLAVAIEVEVLGQLGWPLSEAEVIERFMGRPAQVMREQIVARLGPTLPADWEASLAAKYRQTLESELVAVDGVLEALDRITLPICVASSSNHEWLRLTLGLTGLYERFEGRIFSAADVRHGKPAPDLFLHAAHQLDADPLRCVVVEDSPAGVQAARSAGMRILAFAGGLAPVAMLEGPDTIVFDHMHDLPALIDEYAGIPLTGTF